MFPKLLKKNNSKIFYIIIAVFLVLDFVFFILLQFSKPVKNTPPKITSGQTISGKTEAEIKALSDKLYLSLDFDHDLVADGDLLAINYIFINRSTESILAKDYALSVNFAGPLELALNSGRIIKDISQDILPGQTISGKTAWAVQEYPNRQGGLFNVSLYLSFGDKSGKLQPITSYVKQIRWL